MDSPEELIVEHRGGTVLVTLNRPAKLNSLSEGMYHALAEGVEAWAVDPAVKQVIVRKSGGRAFCAGGDIRILWDWYRSGELQRSAALFRLEYTMDRGIHRFPKPWIALMDGIVMGGGCGISVNHGGFRVVTGETTFAMPETAIGFFPDVGASHFLSRCPGEVGTMLGLTGARLKAADAIRAGLADWYVPSERLDALTEALVTAGDPRAVLEEFAEDPGEAPLAARRDAIDRCFGHDSIEAIVAACEAAGEDDWAVTLRGLAPTSLAVTLRALREGRGRGIEDCLATEYRLCRRFLEHGDLYEGVRALVVDKDKAPKWAELLESSEIEAWFGERAVDGDLVF